MTDCCDLPTCESTIFDEGPAPRQFSLGSNNASGPGYRVLRSGKNIIYAGKISKEGAAEFQKATLEAIAENEKAKNAKKPAVNGAAASATGAAAGPGTSGGTNGGSGTGSKVAGSGTGTPTPTRQAPIKGKAAPAGTASSVCAGRPPESSPAETTCSASLSSSSFPGCPGVFAAEAAGGAEQRLPKTEPDRPVMASSVLTDEMEPPECTPTPAAAPAAAPAEQAPKSKDPDLRFHFSSDGGSLAAGFAMMDTIKEARSQGHTTHCISKGFVGSAATFPAFACEKRFSTEHCLFLLHPPSRAGLQGQTEDIKIHSDNLDMWHSAALKSYYGLSKVKSAFGRIEKLFSDNRYSTAEDMKACGFLDEVWP